MILKTLNQQIRRAFSNSAVHYEVLAGMQYEIGRDLIKTLEWSEDCQRILDVGMGTGKLTNRLSHLCPGAKIFGLDFAQGMVMQAAEKYETFLPLQADASHLPFTNESFDAVFSNLAYQWVDNLPGAFTEARRVLKKDGKFCATLFGRQTLDEFFQALASVESFSQKRTHLQRLPDQAAVREALKVAGFKDLTIKTEIIKTHFDDLQSLLQWLKLIGANRLNRDVYLGPRCLREASDYYEKEFKGRWGVVASFEVIWVKGKK
ncbi:MAG: methyltransferase domain-containing protein [Candidatus Omnitrophica bacterium]|nr:methyltransferase domain-containing protein [Candidatus Omnitrophota bacterium]